MTRRQLLTSTAAIAAAPMLNFGQCRVFGAGRRTYSSRVIDLVGSSVVIDMLGLLTMDWPKLERWHSDPEAFGEADFRQVRRSGIDVLHPAVDLNTSNPREDTLQWLGRWTQFINNHSHRFQAIQKCEDLAAAKRNGKIGILLGMQNSEHFESVEDVALFHKQGQRLSQLTYNSSNRLGSGCTDRRNGGLTPFGEQVVRAMNQSQMIIDVSHASERTTFDAIDVSARPLLITHSNCRALVQHPRCKSDAVIRAMSKKGGVMGITGVRTFLSQRGRATIDDALDHFVHVARLVGVEHLGIGSDAGVDNTEPAPHLRVDGLHLPRRIFDLTDGLLRRGFPERAIRGILGGNFQRALQTIMCA